MTDTVKKTPEEVAADAQAKADAKAIEVAAKPVVKAQAELADAHAAHAEAVATLEEKQAKLDEAKEKFQASLPPKTLFVYDRDTVLEAETIKDNVDGTKDLRVSGVLAQKFMTSASNPPATKEFLNVRRGSGRADVGSYFEG